MTYPLRKRQMTYPLVIKHENRPHEYGRCGQELWGVEYSYTCPERYDGLSERFCPKEKGGCGLRVGRWSGKELKDGEIETRFGESEPYVPNDCACGSQKNPKYPTCFTCFETKQMTPTPEQQRLDRENFRVAIDPGTLGGDPTGAAIVEADTARVVSTDVPLAEYLLSLQESNDTLLREHCEMFSVLEILAKRLFNVDKNGRRIVPKLDDVCDLAPTILSDIPDRSVPRRYEQS